jgi:hypothetical protein
MAFQVNGKAVAYIGTYRGVGLVVEGTSGYYLVSQGGTQEDNQVVARRMNADRGISAEDAEALEFGSCFGWDVPAAGRFRNPRRYACRG